MVTHYEKLLFCFRDNFRFKIHGLPFSEIFFSSVHVFLDFVASLELHKNIAIVVYFLWSSAGECDDKQQSYKAMNI